MHCCISRVVNDLLSIFFKIYSTVLFWRSSLGVSVCECDKLSSSGCDCLVIVSPEWVYLNGVTCDHTHRSPLGVTNVERSTEESHYWANAWDVEIPYYRQ